MVRVNIGEHECRVLHVVDDVVVSINDQIVRGENEQGMSDGLRFINGVNGLDSVAEQRIRDGLEFIKVPNRVVGVTEQGMNDRLEVINGVEQGDIIERGINDGMEFIRHQSMRGAERGMDSRIIDYEQDETLPNGGTSTDSDSIWERVLLCRRREGGGPHPSCLVNPVGEEEQEEDIVDDEGKYSNAWDMAEDDDKEQNDNDAQTDSEHSPGK